MKSKADRIKSLAKMLAAIFDREQRTSRELISPLLDLVGDLQSSSADRRYQRLSSQLKRLQERVELLAGMVRRDFLSKIEREAEELTRSSADSRAASLIPLLLRIEALSLNQYCESLLDLLIEATGAERGFLIFYLPESTEADVVAARNFQTRNLSLEEYNFSRTLFRDVFQSGLPVVIADALHDPSYSGEASVAKFNLKSVLSVPLKQGDRTVGAVYLENKNRVSAFDHEDARLVEAASHLAVFYLSHKRMMPVVFEQESRLFLDSSKASREIIGRDPKIVSLLGTIDRIADSPAIVLVDGETGTGKELIARALHYRSARSGYPFVAINCAAIPEALLESEFFGHEKGAFTGAAERYVGRIEQGDGGTVFLDEISELAYPLQAKLLRFLQSMEFSRLGGRETIRADIRIVAATSKDLRALISAGKFQEALYYRLNVIPLHVPPLRQRKEDIPLLFAHFLKKFCSIYRKSLRAESEACELLKEYAFPGNVRELENMIHRMVALAPGDTIRLGDLPNDVLQIRSQRVSLKRDSLCRVLETPPASFEEIKQRRAEVRRALLEQEREMINRAIGEAGGNLTEAAARLGVHRITLHKMLKRSKMISRI